MSASHFMDKQILGATSSSSYAPSQASGAVPGGGAGGLFDLMNPQEELHQINGKREEILPSYDFHPIRSLGSSPPSSAAPVLAVADTNKPTWGSLDSKITSSNLKNAGLLEPNVLTKASHEEENRTHSGATVAEIDRAVKRYADNLLSALEGVSSQLSQLENRMHHVENSVDELKLAVGNYNGSTDGKLRHFEHILREVQTSVQILRDKQEIMETHVQLSKLQPSKSDSSSDNTNNIHGDPQQQSQQHQQVALIPHAIQPPQQAPSAPQQAVLPLPNAPPAPSPLQNPPPSQFTALPPPNAPQQPPLPNAPPSQFPPLPAPSGLQPPTSQLQNPPLPQYQAPPLPQSQAPPLQRDAYFPPPAQPTDPPLQPYPQSQPAQPLHYQSPAHYPQYSPVPPTSINQTHLPAVGQQPEETLPYAPQSQPFPQNARQPPPFMQPPSGSQPPSYGPNPGPFDSHGSRPMSVPQLSSSYGKSGSSNFPDAYAYSSSPSFRASSSMKSSPFSASTVPPAAGSNYGRLPTAQTLPQAVPLGSSTSSGNGSSSGDRVPLDDVVEKVATMGFSKDHVRATVRRLTENGQNVDLNVVLDKLMNDSEYQPQKGWFGR